MPSLKELFSLLVGAGKLFSDKELSTQGAALAFYTALSFAPLLLLMLTITSWLGTGAEQYLLAQLEALIGPEARNVADMVLNNAHDDDSGTLSTLTGTGTLLLSATLVFAQLQTAMNHIWGVTVREGRGVWNWIRKRLLSLSLIGVVIFLLMVSLSISTILSLLPLQGIGAVWFLLNQLISLLVFGVLFATLYRLLPDVDLPWRDVMLGGLISAVLFAVGKSLIGLYLGMGGVGSAYGAAGSLIAVLVWVYYTSMILFYGASLTVVNAGRSSREICPESHARWVQPRP